MRAPGSRSSALKRNGPLPTTSGTGLNGSVSARRSGIMKQAGTATLPSAVGSSGNGRSSRKRIVRSSGADSSSVASMQRGAEAVTRRPAPDRLAAQSRASTGVPSCHSRPSRSRRSHCLPSFSTRWPSTICGDTSSRLFLAVQRVEHQEGVVAGDVGGSPDRVQDGHVGLGDEFQRAGRLRDGGPGQTQGWCGCEKGAAAYHTVRPRTVSAIPVNRRTPWSSAASSMSKSMAWWTLATSLPTMK